jgi:hypothetical protein
VQVTIVASFGNGRGSVMGNGKISYAGIGASVAGVIGILGIYSHWWESDLFTFNGTADISGQLGLGMAIGLFAMGAAYVLIADPQIRRVTGALATLFAVVLTLSCVWGLLRTDNIAPTADAAMGLFVSGLGGVLGIAASLLVMRDSAASEAAEDLPAASNASMASDATGADTT